MMYLGADKPFLNGDLTLHDLAKELAIPKHYITQVINERMGKNFYSLINEFRVEEVKRRLRDKDSKNFTLLSVGYDCGFNTKSSFYNSFKKIAGVTPAQYRKTLGK